MLMYNEGGGDIYAAAVWRDSRIKCCCRLLFLLFLLFMFPWLSHINCGVGGWMLTDVVRNHDYRRTPPDRKQTKNMKDKMLILICC